MSGERYRLTWASSFNLNGHWTSVKEVDIIFTEQNLGEKQSSCQWTRLGDGLSTLSQIRNGESTSSGESTSVFSYISISKSVFYIILIHFNI